GAGESWPILEILLSFADRNDWFLGYSFSQHSRFFQIRGFSTGPDYGAGSWTSADNDLVRVHWRGSDLGYERDLWRDELASCGCDDALHEPWGVDCRDGFALSGHPRDQHCCQCRQSGKRFRASGPENHFIPYRRLDYRSDWGPDDALETGRRSKWLHLHLA